MNSTFVRLVYLLLFLLSARCLAVTNIDGGTITGDSTWTLAGSPYNLIGDITIAASGTLHIQPGVIVKFNAPDRKIFVYGKLDAQGTAENRIVFTSIYDDSYAGDTNGDGSATLAGRGQWSAIYINSSTTIISYCLIRFGGSAYNWNPGGSIYVDGAKPVIKNVTIEESAQQGIFLNNPAANFTLESDTIRNCSGWGIYTKSGSQNLLIKNNQVIDCSSGIYLEKVHSTTAVSGNTITSVSVGIQINDAAGFAISNNTLNMNNNGYPFYQANTAFPVYSGNTVLNGIKKIGVSGEIRASRIAPNSLVGTWSRIQGEDYVYVMDGEVSVVNENSYIKTTLSIDPGVVVKFQGGDRRLMVYGKLFAQGTADNRIVFTSINDDSYGGDSNGDGAASVPGRGNWETIYINNDESTLAYCLVRFGGYPAHWNPVGNIYVDAAKPVIKNVTVEESAQQGIFINNSTANFTLEQDSIRSCSGWGIYAKSGSLNLFIKNNQVINCGYGIYLEKVHTTTVVSGNTLTSVSEGIQTNDAVGFAINNNTLNMNNSGYPFNQVNTAFPVYSGNTVLNGIKKIAVSGEIKASRIAPTSFVGTWSRIQGEDYVYVMAGDVSIVNENSYIKTTLSIDPGVVVKALGGDRKLLVYGKLTAQGTADNRIVFTSINDDTYGGDSNGDGFASLPARGNWESIYLNSDESTLAYCLVRFGGNPYNWNPVGNILVDGAKPVIKNVIVEESAQNGILINNALANFTLEQDTIRSCSGSGIYAKSGNQNLLIKNNSVINCGSGIYLEKVHPTTVVSGNTVSLVNAGIQTNDAIGFAISNNILDMNNTGYPFDQTNTAFPVYSGNTVLNGIKKISVSGEIKASRIAPNSLVGTWSRIQGEDYVYVMVGEVSVVNENSYIKTTLSIDPGVVVKALGSDRRLMVYGKLIAQGTADNRIVFTSINDDTYGGDSNGDGFASLPARGQWESIYINNDESTLAHCLVRFGGSPNHWNPVGNIYIDGAKPVIKNVIVEESAQQGIFINNSPANFTLEQDTIRSCSGSGIYARAGNQNLLIKNNQVMNCGSGIYLEKVNSTTVVSGNTLSFVNPGIQTNDAVGFSISNNTLNMNNTGYPFDQINTAFPVYSGNTVLNGIKKISVSGEIKASRIAPNSLVGTWSRIQGEDYVYVMAADVSVVNENNFIKTTLSIDPGVVIKAIGGDRRLMVYGKLIAQGTADNKIVFTSINDDSYGGDTNGDGFASLPARGQWESIYINNDESSLTYCLVRFGGSAYHWNPDGNIYVDGAKPVIKNVTVEESAQQGIFINNAAANFTVEQDTVRNCSGWGIYAKSSSQNLLIKNNMVMDCGAGIYLEKVHSTTVVSGNSLTSVSDGIQINDGVGFAISNNILNMNNNGYPFDQVNTAFPVYSGNTVLNGIKKIAVSGEIRASRIAPNSLVGTWSRIQGEDYVYVMTGEVTVANEYSVIKTTLSIDPGVVVKAIGGDRRLMVYDKLIAQGTPDNRIVFTSIYDDTYGGDSNGDGFASLPARGNWEAIYINNDESTIAYCLVRFGGNPYHWNPVGSVYVDASKPVIKNVTVEESAQNGIYLRNCNSSSYYLNKITAMNNSGSGMVVNNSSFMAVTNSLFVNNGAGVSNENASYNISNSGFSKNNTAISNSGNSNIVINSNDFNFSNDWAVYADGQSGSNINLTIYRNNFEHNTNLIKLINYQDPSILIAAQNNYYGTTDTNQIISRLYHKPNDGNSPLIIWRPFENNRIDHGDTTFCRADINQDAIVNGIDLAILGGAFGSLSASPFYNMFADIDKSGRVDGFDLAILGINFGKTGSCLPGNAKAMRLANIPKLSIRGNYLQSNIGDTSIALIYLRGLQNPYAFAADLIFDSNFTKIVKVEDGGLFSSNKTRQISLMTSNYENSKIVGMTRFDRTAELPDSGSSLMEVKMIKLKSISTLSNVFQLSGLKIMNMNGEWFDSIDVEYNILTEVSEKNPPRGYALYQNYPNPFNPSTVIKYEIPGAGKVELKIFDMLGAEVSTLVNKYQTAGYYQVELNMNNKALSSGVYIYRLVTDKCVISKKLIYLR